MTLFCFSVTRNFGYELELIKKQHDETIGIFACDATAVLCSDPLILAPNFNVTRFQSATVGVSDVGFAAISRLFNNAWQSIKADGRYKHFDWTIKVDPDAVLMPNRLWRTLSQHTGKSVFVNNCGMYQISAMYGSLEAISHAALDILFELG